MFLVALGVLPPAPLPGLSPVGLMSQTSTNVNGCLLNSKLKIIITIESYRFSWYYGK